jgi:hypothetical protein
LWVKKKWSKKNYRKIEHFKYFYCSDQRNSRVLFGDLCYDVLLIFSFLTETAHVKITHHIWTGMHNWWYMWKKFWVIVVQICSCNTIRIINVLGDITITKIHIKKSWHISVAVHFLPFFVVYLFNKERIIKLMNKK